MAGRYTGWKRVRGDAGNPELVSIGQKLLGQLAERRKLSGVKTLALTHRLADGSTVRARFVGDQPIVEIVDVGGETREIPLRTLQGFVVRPQGSLPTDLDEALMIPGAPIDPDNRPWACLYYNATHVPVPGPAIGGSYRATALGDALFKDGLIAGGNLDWRNADESMVVTFFGPEDRYSLNGNIWGNNDPARQTGSAFLCPFSTLIMINGDVVMDFADHPGYNEFDVVIGACVRDGALVWCLVGRDAPAQYMRFYTAPLLRRPGYSWAAGPVINGPRFARIDHANTVLLHEELLNLFDYFFLFQSQPFCFNQSATEGRMLTEGPGGAAPSNNDGTHELVFNFTDLENPIFTDTWLGEDATVVGNVGPGIADHASLTVVLNGWETTTNTDYKAELPLRIKQNNYKRTQAHDPILNKVAVDYKNDAPVYLQVRQPMEIFHEVTTSADPICVPDVDAFTTSNTTSSTSIQTHAAAIVFPWGLEIAVSRLQENTHSGTASSAYTDTTLTDMTGTFITASSSTLREYHVEWIHVLYADLRADTAVYGLVVSDATEDITYSKSLVSTTVLGPLEKTTTTNRHITRTWQQVVHALGADVAVGTPQVVLDTTTNTPEFSSTTIIGTDNFLSNAHDTGPGIAGIGFNAQASGEQAYRPFGTTLVNAVVAAGVGVEVDAGIVTPPPPFPATVDYAPTRVTLQLDDVPWDELHDPILGWLYSGGGESTSVMPWAKQNINFSIPLADPVAAPYEFIRESVGAWQTLVDATVFTMPWPTGTAEGYMSGASDANFQTVTGLPGNGIHLPIWLMSKFQTR